MKRAASNGRDIVLVGAYQGPTRVGAFDANAEHALEALREAHRRGVDFACLPECFLTGYGAAAEIESCAVSTASRPFREFVKQCGSLGDMVSIVGLYERRGKHIHNSAAVIHRGKLAGVHRKSIPGSPDEKNAVTCLSDFRVFRLRGVTFGVLVCYEGALLEPALLLAERGARIIFEPHYSCIPAGNMDWHRQRVRNSRTARAVENACWYVKANVAPGPARERDGDAAPDGLLYGDSFILDPIGRPRAEAGLFTTGWITADVPRGELTRERESRVNLAPMETRRQVARLYLGRK